MTKVLVRPSMPKEIAKYDRKEFEENSFQKSKKPKNKIEHQRMQAAKKSELILREANDSASWDKIFENTLQGEINFKTEDDVAQQIKKHFEEMTEGAAEDCVLTTNFGKWAKAAQGFWFDKCGEEKGQIKHAMGELPEFKIKPVVKAKRGDLRDMVLPGGGDIRTRLWASMSVKVNSLAKWQKSGVFETSASKDAMRRLEQFALEEGELGEHTWEDISDNEALQMKVEISFLLDSFERKATYDTTDLQELLKTITHRALKKRQNESHNSVRRQFGKKHLST